MRGKLRFEVLGRAAIGTVGTGKEEVLADGTLDDWVASTTVQVGSVRRYFKALLAEAAEFDFAAFEGALGAKTHLPSLALVADVLTTAKSQGRRCLQHAKQSSGKECELGRFHSPCDECPRSR